MRNYRDRELAVAFRRGQIDGFKRGAESMRVSLVRDFGGNAPAGLLRAGEVTAYIAGAQAPTWEPAAETPAELKAGSLPSEGPSNPSETQQ